MRMVKNGRSSVLFAKKWWIHITTVKLILFWKQFQMLSNDVSYKPKGSTNLDLWFFHAWDRSETRLMGRILNLVHNRPPLCYIVLSPIKEWLQLAHEKTAGGVSCDNCQKAFASSGRLHDHTRSCGKTFPCGLCEVSCGSERALKSHLVKHSGEFTCEMCNKALGSASELKRHKESHEGFLCDVCNIKYSTKSSLNRHKKKFSH